MMRHSESKLCGRPAENPLPSLPAATWDAIARLVAAVSIPVLGNGDVFEVSIAAPVAHLNQNASSCCTIVLLRPAY